MEKRLKDKYAGALKITSEYEKKLGVYNLQAINARIELYNTLENVLKGKTNEDVLDRLIASTMYEYQNKINEMGA